MGVELADVGEGNIEENLNDVTHSDVIRETDLVSDLDKLSVLDKSRHSFSQRTRDAESSSSSSEPEVETKFSE